MKLAGLDLGSSAIRVAVPENDTFRIVSLSAPGPAERPSSYSAAIAAGLRAADSAGLGPPTPVSAAVLTVPVGAHPAEIAQLKQAATALGLERVRLVPGPVAAVLSSAQRGELEGPVLVLDLGRSGLSVAVVDVASPRVEVLHMDRTPTVSGDAFDELAAALLVELSGASPTPEILAAAARQARLARHELTDHFEVRTLLEGAPGFRRPVKLSRDQLEQRLRPLLMGAEPAIRQTLSAALLRPDDLGGLLLVGGGAYIPVVRRFATEVLGRRIRVPEVPETRAARGAAAYAQALWGGGPPLRLTPVLPWAVRATSLDDSPVNVLPRSCPLPVRATVTRPAELPLHLMGERGSNGHPAPQYLTVAARGGGDRPVAWTITADVDAVLSARPASPDDAVAELAVRAADGSPNPGAPAEPAGSADPAAEARRRPTLLRDARALRAQLAQLADRGAPVPADAVAALDAALQTGSPAVLAEAGAVVEAWLVDWAAAAGR